MWLWLLLLIPFGLLLQNAARKANQKAIAAEKKREDAPEEVRGVSKKKWFEERQKRLGKVLDANGLDMKKAYMLDTQEQAEEKYDKWEKKPAPFGWDGQYILLMTIGTSLAGQKVILKSH
jgi:hypothetical protein